MTMDEQGMIKYLQGECSVGEETLFLEWLHQSDANRELFYQTKALWNHRNIKHFAAEEQINAAVAKLNRNIDAVEARRKKKRYLRVYQYAAILILALAIPYIFYTTVQHTGADSGFITVTVDKTDSSRLVTLSDGSHVWLNSHSSLTYPEKFGKGDRYVTFTGEGYFEITHDSLHPFHVRTRNVQVRVLGTSFNVRAYPAERKTETTLVKGKVIIQDKQGANLAMLTPGQMAEFDKANRYLSVKEVDTTSCTSWRYGLIVFTNAKLSDITHKLSELYHVQFINNAPIDNVTTYNFNFRKSQPVEKVMEMLSFIAPVDYQMQDKGIVITEKH